MTGTGTDGNRSGGVRGRNNRGGRNFARDKPATDHSEVPILKYGPGSNWVVFKEKLSKVALEKYGDLGRLVEDEQYYDPPQVDRSKYDLNNDADGFNKILLQEALKARQKLVLKMESERASFYGYLMTRLSNESVDAVKRDSKYGTFSKSLDVLELYKAIKSIHVRSTVSTIDEVVAKQAKDDYHNVKQGEFESIVSYKANFDVRLAEYQHQCKVTLDDNAIAMDFLYGLDKSRYASFIEEILNDLAKKTMAKLKDLNQIYELAANRIVIKQNSKIQGGASFTTLDKLKKKGKGGKGGKGKGGNKDNETPEDEVKAEPTSEPNAESKEQPKTNKKERDLSKITCWNCDRKGHFARDCTEPERDPTNGCTTAATGTTIGRYEIAIDSCSDVSIVHPRFLSNLRKEDSYFFGIGGSRTEVDQVGDLEFFFPCIACKECQGSILSMDAVEKKYRITYNQNESIIVHLDHEDLVFKKRGKFYIANFSRWITNGAANATITSKELRLAQQAGELVRVAGYPSQQETERLILDGNIVNIPSEVRDVQRYYEAYGEPTAAVRGKHTRQIPNTRVLQGHAMERTIQTMFSDVMHVMGQTFLLTVTEPLNLVMQSYLASEHHNDIGYALQSQVDLLASRGFRAKDLYADPQSSIGKVETSFPGIAFDLQGAGDHLAKIDAKVRRVKEVCRSVLSSLPYKLPEMLVRDLVQYAVNRINVRRTTSLTDNRAPRVLFTGRRIDFKKEFKAGFGDYVEAYNPKVQSNAVDQPRTQACIALYPSANVVGSWILFNIATGKRVRRTNFRVMKVNDQVIAAMNNAKPAEVDVIPMDSDQVDTNEVVEAVGEATHVPEVVRDFVDNAEPEDDVDHGVDVADNAAEETDEVVISPSERIVEVVPEVRTRSGRQVRATNDPNYVYTTYDARKKAFVDEILQLFKEKEVLQAVKLKDIGWKHRRNIIRSFMFLKEKFLPTGEFDKYKGRLVADGRMQDRELITGDISSPTASFTSVLISLVKAASSRNVRGLKIDIKGAFLNALLDELVYLMLDKESTKIAVELMPELKSFVVNGHLYVLVKKALYGLVQASKLWYETIRKVLLENGFDEIEKCVFVKGQDILLLYVDDILLLSDNHKLFDEVKTLLIKEFDEITVDDELTLNYLGMSLSFQSDGIKLNMKGYIESILKDMKIGNSTVPSTRDIFIVNEDDGKLSDAKRFHTMVARLLYLSKRVRPDLLLPISYLCTRVNEPSVDDDKKLSKVIEYLNSTKDKGLKISRRDRDAPTVECFVDASFATHADGKGHTGCVILVNGSMVYASSRKQKICTKDSTESEIVGVSDNITVVESVTTLVNKLFGAAVRPIVYQDNQAAIKLMNDAVGRQRTKHITARLSCIKEAAADWDVVYCKTEDMIADVLTKSMKPKTFHKMIGKIMNGMSRAKVNATMSMKKESVLAKLREKKRMIMMRTNASFNKDTTTRVRCRNQRDGTRAQG